MSDLFRKFFRWGSIAAAIAIITFFSIPHYRQGEASIAGKTAEDFAIELNGKPAHLSDLRGKVVVLNFWATWCKPCEQEIPALVDLNHRIAGRGGTVLGVSVDEDEAAYKRFLEQYGVNFLTYRDPSKKDAEAYGTELFPETYIIDRQGKIARKIVGYQNWNSPEMLAYFDAILAQK